MYIKVLTVSDINNYIKRNFDNDFILQNSSVKGEISNIKFHSSGHIYFSLKDEFSKINCIMFKNLAKNLKFVPEDGMRIIVKGKISVYEREGQYQFYCNEMKLEGVGELYVAFEKLKTELRAKGLFDEKHKKPIPKYSFKIGVVTSPTGAALRDIINVTRRRNEAVKLLVYPSLVQGVNAADNIVKGIEILNNIEDIDLIILARGGGSIEDLWCFNEQKVAEAIYNSDKPIITGVGHEIDYTIADFAADKRAPTPSAAAEIAVFDLKSTFEKIGYYRTVLNGNIISILKSEKEKLLYMKKRIDSSSPLVYIANQYVNIDRMKEILNVKAKAGLASSMEKFNKLKEILESRNPLNILNRGYSIIQDEKDHVVSSIDKVSKIDKVKIIMKDGSGQFNISRIQN